MVDQRPHACKTDWFAPNWPTKSNEAIDISPPTKDRQFRFTELFPRDDSQNRKANSSQPVGPMLRGLLIVSWSAPA